MFSFWRRHPDSDWGIEVLQTCALPLGYGAVLERKTRFALATFALARRRSTTEPLPQIGAFGRNRTTDTGIFSPLLYRLSYRGISGAIIPAPSRAILANFGAPAKACEARFCGEEEKFQCLSQRSCFARLPDKRLTFRRGASDRNRTNDTETFSSLL